MSFGERKSFGNWVTGPEQKNRVANSSPSITESSKGSGQSSSLKKQPFKRFIWVVHYNSKLESVKGKAMKTYWGIRK